LLLPILAVEAFLVRLSSPMVAASAWSSPRALKARREDCPKSARNRSQPLPQREER